MKFSKIIVFLLILILPANANTIYNLIKIPNLEIYEDKSLNGLKYLKATKPFKVGIRNNNVVCLNSSSKSIDKLLSEDDLYKLELDSFMRLIETKQTQERIRHTLSTGKTLVN